MDMLRRNGELVFFSVLAGRRRIIVRALRFTKGIAFMPLIGGNILYFSFILRIKLRVSIGGEIGGIRAADIAWVHRRNRTLIGHPGREVGMCNHYVSGSAE